MDQRLKHDFSAAWARHFPGAELPIAFFFSDAPRVPLAPPAAGWRCFIPGLAPVRRGKPLAFGIESLGCEGVKQYAGFIRERAADLDLFLSCGVPGGREGLRLKASPELVRESQARAPQLAAGGRYLVAKRWDLLDADDEPEVVTFFVKPDALSGLVTLSGFDRPDDEGTASPSVAGCSSAFGRAYAERDAPSPRCFVGLFDFTPRQWVASDELTFSAPFGRFREMAENLPWSFARTEGWRRIAGRSRG